MFQKLERTSSVYGSHIRKGAIRVKSYSKLAKAGYEPGIKVRNAVSEFRSAKRTLLRCYDEQHYKRPGRLWEVPSHYS